MVGRSGKGINSGSPSSGVTSRRVRSACLCHMLRCAVRYVFVCAYEDVCVLHM